MHQETTNEMDPGFEESADEIAPEIDSLGEEGETAPKKSFIPHSRSLY